MVHEDYTKHFIRQWKLLFYTEFQHWKCQQTLLKSHFKIVWRGSCLWVKCSMSILYTTFRWTYKSHYNMPWLLLPLLLSVLVAINLCCHFLGTTVLLRSAMCSVQLIFMVSCFVLTEVTLSRKTVAQLHLGLNICFFAKNVTFWIMLLSVVAYHFVVFLRLQKYFGFMLWRWYKKHLF